MVVVTTPRTLGDFGPLSAAEQQVLNELDTGRITLVGDGRVPNLDAGPERRIRAAFLRWLATGDQQPGLHETGLRVRGALVVGEESDHARTRGLDLEGCVLKVDLWLVQCRFARPILLIDASLDSLFLNGSRLPGLIAEGLETRGSIVLNGARIDGPVQLPGARIGGKLNLVNARLHNPGGVALDANGARIRDTFILRQGARVAGTLDLAAAEIREIDDEPACWPGPGDLVLDRCHYGAFLGLGIDAVSRRRWLELQDAPGAAPTFRPQPYERCARVLREAGHLEDAREILVAKHRRQGRHLARTASGPLMRRLVAAGDRVLDETVRYGHRPLRAFVWLFRFWLVGCVVFALAAEADAIKPNNAFILRTPEWFLCGVPADRRVETASLAGPASGRAAPGQSQLDCFLDQEEAAAFPRFNPAIYALDVVLPVIAIEQHAYWVPDERRPIGALAKIVVYLLIIAGWALSLLAVAGFSGLVKRD